MRPLRETQEPLLRRAQEHALDYLATVEDRAIFPTRDARAALEAFEEPLPEVGAEPLEMLDQLHRLGSPATTAQVGGRYFGFVNGGAHPPAVAARWLADVWDQNVGLGVMSPVCQRLEEVTERWLVDLLHLPAGTAAGFVTGTSIAITCALAAARNELLSRAGWDVAGQGLFGAPPLRVVVGEEAHVAVFRSLSILGLGRERVEIVPSDDQGRLRPERLPALDDRTLVVAQAGNVNSGAFDPMRPICEAARAAGAWVHVDGAFGLWAGASRRAFPMYDGVQLADSWSVDAHKTLNAPYDCGIVLCRDRRALVAALSAQASYLLETGGREGLATTPDMSRRGRVVDLWATLKTLGRRGVERLVDQLCERAWQCADRLRDHGFEVPNEVVFNQVLVAFRDQPTVDALLRELTDSGECWCGSAVWRGRPVVRISVCSARTTREDIERTVAAFVAARERIEGPLAPEATTEGTNGHGR